MKKTLPAQESVLETILEWSQDRPAWQRDALRRIVLKGHLDSNDLTDLIGLCKQEKGGKSNNLKPDPLAKIHIPGNPGQDAEVSLISIADVKGVNNLAPGQTLVFEQNGITIVYGYNGAGKSGYSRILKRVCRSRYSGKITPNIYDQNPSMFAAATITYAIGDKEQPPEKWKDSENPHATMSAVSVFDSDCASVHIKEKNEVAFRPFGLDVPDELAEICKKIKDKLTEEKILLEKARNPIFLKPSWKDTSVVGKALAVLKHDTDITKIEALVKLTDEEMSRLQHLNEDLSKDLIKASAEQNLKADNVKRLLDVVVLLEEKTTDLALTGLASAAKDATTKREAAQVAANQAFSGEPLKGVGDEAWRVLWESARRYSTEIAYPSQTFPSSQTDARCVLCQQLLSAEARDRMIRFEEFIQKDTERQAQEAEKTYKLIYQNLLLIGISTRSIKTNLQEISLENQEMAKLTRRFIASCRLRRYTLLKSLAANKSSIVLPPFAANPAPELSQIEKDIRNYATELKKSAVADERKKLELEFAELNDRNLLKSILQIVQEEVERLKTIHFLEECIRDTSTNSITNMGNNIADTIITPKMRDRFQKEIVKLAADKVRVEIVRSGGNYGSPHYQVRLFAKPDAKVQDILSEGEKTCVALAAFFTELTTAAHHSALVFDDPVSSLDHRWRKNVAKRLIEESENRQIIVFTHDLILVNDLIELLEKKKPLRLVTVSHGKIGAGIVSDGLPWIGKSIEDRIDKLEKEARDAKILYDGRDEEEYAKETAEIYSKLRASWERALEEIAFFRVVQRHRDYIDTKNLKKVSVLTHEDCDAFQSRYKKCCTITDAHDPSSARNAEVPTPDEIMLDIQALKDWVDRLRSKQKMVT